MVVCAGQTHVDSPKVHKDFEQIVIVPATTKAFGIDASAFDRFFSFEQAQGQPAQTAEVFSTVSDFKWKSKVTPPRVTRSAWLAQLLE